MVIIVTDAHDQQPFRKVSNEILNARSSKNDNHEKLSSLLLETFYFMANVAGS